ncbi:hypothetical protein ACO1O0_000713 [Amphichorda felina]
MRSRFTLPLASAVFFCFILYSLGRISSEPTVLLNRAAQPPPAPEQPTPASWRNPPPPKITGSTTPKKAQGTGLHPIEDLINDQQREFDAVRKRQSKSLKEAVDEYRRRYKMSPPPNFDKWFEFAKTNKVQLVDEFDTIYDLITPFWGLKPKTIRERAKEALGGDNFLLGVAIRNHRIKYMDGAEEWQRNATEGMINKFANYLPDMDLAFNIHDEPRVMVPADDMSRLVGRAKDTNMPLANSVTKPFNDFSPPAKELGRGAGFDETKVTRFNSFARQPTWSNSRMSCPPESPARSLEEDEQIDYISEYGYSDLGFIYNVTAMSDVCINPSVSTTHGFFAPNAYSVVHDLFPIFSQSKISTYGDLIYPSPWYWYDRVAYDEKLDMPWEKKGDQLYWRGSTTGGFSRRGGWRRQHRQRFVQKINGRGEGKIMVRNGGGADAEWHVSKVSRGEHSDLVDVQFSHIGQCDPGDCQAQVNFFNPAEPADQQAAWGYKYLLDMDGNAFSGRFYAFLRSRSLVFKMALFREWHFDWLRPWLHYVPLSLQGDDWLEATRFFGSADGTKHAQKIAAASREWANKAVRKEDMEAWFFRLLLE